MVMLAAGDSLCQGIIPDGSRDIYSGNEAEYVSVGYSPGGSFLFAVTKSNICTVHNGRTLAIEPFSIKINPNIRDYYGNSIDVDGKERILAYCAEDGVAIIDLAGNREIRKLPFISDRMRYGPGCVAVSRAGDRVAAADYLGNLRVWEEIEGEWKVVKSAEKELSYFRAISFLHDGKRICIGGGKRIEILNIETGELESLPAMNKVLCMSISSDGSLIAAGEEHGLVEIWDLGTGEKVFEYVFDGTGSADGVRSVSFSKDDAVFLAASGGVLRMWMAGSWIDAAGYDRYAETFSVSFNPARDEYAAGKSGLIQVYEYRRETGMPEDIDQHPGE